MKRTINFLTVICILFFLGCVTAEKKVVDKKALGFLMERGGVLALVKAERGGKLHETLKRVGFVEKKMPIEITQKNPQIISLYAEDWYKDGIFLFSDFGGRQEEDLIECLDRFFPKK